LFKKYFQIPIEVGSPEMTPPEDKKCQQFIVAILQKLEPRKYESKEVIYEELEEVEEMLFVTEGEVRSIDDCSTEWGTRSINSSSSRRS